MRLAGLAVLGSVVLTKPMSCNPPAESESITVYYNIPSGPGTRGLELQGCTGTLSASGEDLFEVTPGWGACNAIAWRKDGQLHVESQPVGIDLESPLQYIDFSDLPTGPIGGMGAYVYESDGAIRISGVVPGHPAFYAGLNRGDRILSIDSLPTNDMSTEEFVRRATGPVGSTYQMSVSRDGQCPTDITIVRERI